jgi:hypothetical protein
MPVMMISDVAGQTPLGYEMMLRLVAEDLARAPGFLIHAAHPAPEGWRIVEVWESQSDAAAFFSARIAPNLPPGIRPKLRFEPLHGLIRPAPPAAGPAVPAQSRAAHR